MPDTVDDFIKRFGGGSASADEDNDEQTQARQTEHFYDRFVSNDPKDEAFNNESFHQGAAEYLGKLPDDQFQQAASKAYSQMEAPQQQGLVNSLLGALQGRGVNLESLAGMLGINAANPQQMSPEDYARLANYTRREQPEAMKQVVAEKPWWLKALGHPVVMGALGMIAAKWLRGREQNQ